MPGYSCAGLGDHETDLMSFPGAFLLHEMFHYFHLFDDLPGWDTHINIGDGYRMISDLKGTYPPSGYTPLNA